MAIQEGDKIPAVTVKATDMSDVTTDDLFGARRSFSSLYPVPSHRLARINICRGLSKMPLMRFVRRASTRSSACP